MSSSDGDGDDYDPSQPLPPSQYFGGQGGDGGDDDGGNDDGEDEDLPAGLAAALDGFNEDGDFDKLPPYANDTNKALNTQLVAKEKKLQQHTDQLAENGERVSIMTDHLRNVEQEHLHTQALVDAKAREIETEEHLRALAERETGRIASDNRKIEQYMVECQDQLNSYQNSMFTANEKLEQFKLQMNWNQEELLQWSLAAKQKDEDRAALEKYEQVDSQKIKNLTLKMEKATKLLQERKKELEDSVTESQAVQIELDKTAEQYRTLHVERQDLINKWNDAVSAMMKRDMDIAAVGEEIQKYKSEARDKSRVLSEEKEFLLSEEVNNSRLTVTLGTAERTCLSKRELFMNQQQEMSDFNSEVAAQRNELEKAESELLATNTMNDNLEGMKDEKLRQLADYKNQLDAAKEKLSTEYMTTDDLQERSKQVDMLNLQNQNHLKKIVKELQNYKEEMFKHSHELYNLRKEEADLIAEISGSQGTSRNLQARIHELDQRSLKQQEMLYNIEFQVQQMERKVSRASGKRSLEETIELNEEIARLQLSLEEHVAQNKMIVSQVKRLHDDLRAAKRKYDDVLAEKKHLSEKLAEIELENDSSSTEVKTAIKQKEETIVAHDVLKLEVKRLRDLLNSKADEVLNLENRKLQLELSMAERQKEVQLHQDVQKAEIKSAEEQRHNLAMDLKERQIKVDKLKNKFSVIAGKLQNDDGEEKSQAYFIIQAAQNREELQREGDELNSHIRKAEKEIRMLARTLQHLGQRNQVYRESFKKADPQGSEAKLKGDLEEQHRSVADSLYKKKSYLREIATDYEERKRIMNELSSNIQRIDVEVNEKSREIQEVKQHLEEQEAALIEASRAMMDKRDEFRSSKNLSPEDDFDSIEELQISLSEQKRKNRVMLNLLRHFTEENPAMTEAVGQTLADVGLRLLQRPSSSGSTASRAGLYSAGSRRGGRPDSASSDLPPISSRPGSRGR